MMDKMRIERPMLAYNKSIDPELLTYPVLVSPKLDGIRCIVQHGEVLSRTFKPIPNKFIRATLENIFYEAPFSVDGELIVGKNFQETTSAVMSIEGEPSFIYYMFDLVKNDGEETPFAERYMDLVQKTSAAQISYPSIRGVIHEVCEDPEDLLHYEELFVSQGHEGLMIRSIDGPYKFGRSTLKEGYLLKMKRFMDSEAVIIDCEEQMENTNPSEKNDLGYAKKSTHKDGKVGKDTLGKFMVRDLATGHEFGIGSMNGVTNEQRQIWWDDREGLVGKIIKYKYQPFGVKKLPRIPIFLGFRDKEDM